MTHPWFDLDEDDIEERHEVVRKRMKEEEESLAAAKENEEEEKEVEGKQNLKKVANRGPVIVNPVAGVGGHGRFEGGTAHAERSTNGAKELGLKPGKRGGAHKGSKSPARSRVGSKSSGKGEKKFS